jgi:hypothetical protein
MFANLDNLCLDEWTGYIEGGKWATFRVDPLVGASRQSTINTGRIVPCENSDDHHHFDAVPAARYVSVWDSTS